MRPPDTYRTQDLLARLTPPQRYAHGFYMTAGQVAKWLQRPSNTVARWRARNGFPSPAGRAVTRGRYKVRHGWCPREVMAWLKATGRLVQENAGQPLTAKNPSCIKHPGRRQEPTLVYQGVR